MPPSPNCNTLILNQTLALTGAQFSSGTIFRTPAITCNDRSEQANNVNVEEVNQPRKRKRTITWYNQSYSMIVKTNISKAFFQLFQKYFPPTHPMYTTFNKNKINIICSCFPNMGSIISFHNKHILNSSGTEYRCYRISRDECPL